MKPLSPKPQVETLPLEITEEKLLYQAMAHHLAKLGKNLTTFPACTQLREGDDGTISLTAREIDVALRVVRGYSNKRIAVELGISDFTVRDHVSALLAKCAVTTRTRLAVVLSAGFLVGGVLLLDRVRGSPLQPKD